MTQNNIANELDKKEQQKETDALKKKLFFQGELAWDRMLEQDRTAAYDFCDGYKEFLDRAKTEREAAAEIVRHVEGKGFRPLRPESDGGPNVYAINRKKNAALAVLGRKPLEEGLRIIVSHIDSPRLDLKQNPLYEEVELAFLKTHYYGGIKKYQWVARPLALHGVLIRGDGSSLDIRIGEEEGEPVLTILDLLPHLARNAQYNKKLPDAIIGEKLNALVAALPFPDKDAKERFKLQLLQRLHEMYNLVEEDFISAELELVPAGRARDVGLDRSMVGAYGQDDRVCAYCSMQALLDTESPPETILALFMDKEEIGSEGNTSGKSRFMEDVVVDLFRMAGAAPEEYLVRKALMNSRALSADVNGAMDPDYQEVHEKRNAAKMGYGVCITKFTGSGGKYNSSDAHAEYMGWIRRIFNSSNVVWQTGELGKVDEGGGGTLAKYLAEYGMEIVDCGTALLSMHSPFEIAHKADIYMTYKAFHAFLSAQRE
ncbi:MAG: aminopeptidase [Deltaproteobacteria bacterium]|nr:aminopeptidase [Deltaproteobacteria bacterium]MBW2308176.1 aminopeptidase [Deltaproteobacteria bacterium]